MSAGEDSIYDRLERPRRVPPRVYVGIALLVIAISWLASGGTGVWMAMAATSAMSLASMVR